jgi:hypothetical protein
VLIHHRDIIAATLTSEIEVKGQVVAGQMSADTTKETGGKGSLADTALRLKMILESGVMPRILLCNIAAHGRVTLTRREEKRRQEGEESSLSTKEFCIARFDVADLLVIQHLIQLKLLLIPNKFFESP